MIVEDWLAPNPTRQVSACREARACPVNRRDRHVQGEIIVSRRVAASTVSFQYLQTASWNAQKIRIA